MIHFTPIQEVGQSGSAYSLYNQNMISNRIFSAHHVVDAAQPSPVRADTATGTTANVNGGGQLVDPEWETQKRKRLKEVFDFGIAKGVLTLGDVVLNHTANNSNWLEYVCCRRWNDRRNDIERWVDFIRGALK